MRSRRIARDARRIPEHVEFPAAALRKLRTLQRVSGSDFRPIRRRCASRDLYIFRSASLRYTQSGLTRSAYDECSPPQTLARAGDENKKTLNRLAFVRKEIIPPAELLIDEGEKGQRDALEQ